MNNLVKNKKIEKIVSLVLTLSIFLAIFITNANDVKAADYSAWSAIYDGAYYYSHYADAKAYAGTNSDKLWQYFVQVGIPRGDQACAEFNVFIYAKNYPDLVKAFGGNYMSYYLHYAKVGKAEGRNAKTLLNQQPAKPAAQNTAAASQPATNANVTATTTAQSNMANGDYRKAVINLVNEERASRGLSPLAESDALDAIAQERAQEIITLFSHTRPNGQDVFPMIIASGINYHAAGENIAGGQNTPEWVMDSWMNSTGHRANILNSSFGHIGVGCVTGGKYGIYWVQVFTD